MQLRITGLLLLLLAAAPASQPIGKLAQPKWRLKADAPAPIAKWFNDPASQNAKVIEIDKQLEEVNAAIGEAKTTIATPASSYPIPSERPKYVAQARITLKEKNALLKSLTTARESAIADSSLPALPELRFEMGSYGTFGGGIIYRVVDSNRIIVEVGNVGLRLMLRGCPTANLADKMPIPNIGPVALQTTESFEGATYLVAEPMPYEPWLEMTPPIKN